MKAVSRRGAAVDVGAAVNPALLRTADTNEKTADRYQSTADRATAQLLFCCTTTRAAGTTTVLEMIVPYKQRKLRLVQKY